MPTKTNISSNQSSSLLHISGFVNIGVQKQVIPCSAFVSRDQLPHYSLEDGVAFHGHQSEQSLFSTVESFAIEQLGGIRLGGCFHILAKFDDSNHTIEH